MAKFSDYVDSSYLPGEVYSAGLEDYGAYPFLKTAYMAKKKFKFQPGTDEGQYFQRFLAMQNDPEIMARLSMPLPETPFGSFQDFMT